MSLLPGLRSAGAQDAGGRECEALRGAGFRVPEHGRVYLDPAGRHSAAGSTPGCKRRKTPFSAAPSRPRAEPRSTVPIRSRRKTQPLLCGPEIRRRPLETGWSQATRLFGHCRGQPSYGSPLLLVQQSSSMNYKTEHEIHIEATHDPAAQSTRPQPPRDFHRRRHPLADPRKHFAPGGLSGLRSENGAATQPLRTHGCGLALEWSARETVSAREEVPLSAERMPALASLSSPNACLISSNPMPARPRA